MRGKTKLKDPLGQQLNKHTKKLVKYPKEKQGEYDKSIYNRNSCTLEMRVKIIRKIIQVA